MRFFGTINAEQSRYIVSCLIFRWASQEHLVAPVDGVYKNFS